MSSFKVTLMSSPLTERVRNEGTALLAKYPPEILAYPVEYDLTAPIAPELRDYVRNVPDDLKTLEGHVRLLVEKDYYHELRALAPAGSSALITIIKKVGGRELYCLLKDELSELSRASFIEWAVVKDDLEFLEEILDEYDEYHLLKGVIGKYARGKVLDWIVDQDTADAYSCCDNGPRFLVAEELHIAVTAKNEVLLKRVLADKWFRDVVAELLVLLTYVNEARYFLSLIRPT